MEVKNSIMENRNHLQIRAEQLREKYRKQQEEKQAARQQIAQKEADIIQKKFSEDFPELFRLLMISQAVISAHVLPDRPKKSIVISLNNRQMEIIFEEMTAHRYKWSYKGKEYTPTLAGKETDELVNREAEEKLIIAVEEALY